MTLLKNIIIIIVIIIILNFKQNFKLILLLLLLLLLTTFVVESQSPVPVCWVGANWSWENRCSSQPLGACSLAYSQKHDLQQSYQLATVNHWLT